MYIGKDVERKITLGNNVSLTGKIKTLQLKKGMALFLGATRAPVGSPIQVRVLASTPAALPYGCQCAGRLNTHRLG